MGKASTESLSTKLEKSIFHPFIYEVSSRHIFFLLLQIFMSMERKYLDMKGHLLIKRLAIYSLKSFMAAKFQ